MHSLQSYTLNGFSTPTHPVCTGTTTATFDIVTETVTVTVTSGNQTQPICASDAAGTRTFPVTVDVSGTFGSATLVPSGTGATCTLVGSAPAAGKGVHTYSCTLTSKDAGTTVTFTATTATGECVLLRCALSPGSRPSPGSLPVCTNSQLQRPTAHLANRANPSSQLARPPLARCALRTAAVTPSMT